MIKTKDWSLNLEDPYYEEHPDKLMEEAVTAVEQTMAGCYVNLVTPSALGDPEEWLFADLQEKLRNRGIKAGKISYIDQCGCGGYVTRVFQ